MAKSRFEYVRQFEGDDTCLPACWIVVRIDGKAFHRFSKTHHFAKPNDDRSLSLMSDAASCVMRDFHDVILAYGQSDEYSFVFRKNTKTYNRRASKLVTNVVSLFAASFVFHWPRHFPSETLLYPPAFDGRVVLYPSSAILRDYLSWRQADCHINNMYNTCFWKLVSESGLSANDAQQRLKGTLSADKNEILFSEFNTNYNNLPQLYRKGTTLIRSQADDIAVTNKEQPSDIGDQTEKVPHLACNVLSLHVDIIGGDFWRQHPELLGKDP